MVNFKFKEGDYVEIIKSESGSEGHRFIISRFGVKDLVNEDGTPHSKSRKSYKTDLKSTINGNFKWSEESCLKLVNPDTDAISKSSFSEIINEISNFSLITEQ